MIKIAMLKIPYVVFTYHIFMWVRKLDSDSLTETKNWRGRNEVIETSGRLHPSWPQNKRLRTPWTADWMHTGQDRWIQTELVFTLAKNATKPNTFEIISLQTTRKKNNWKTKETLARAVATLETERIKGSKPWCWWWRWLCFHIVDSFPFSWHFLHSSVSQTYLATEYFWSWDKNTDPPKKRFENTFEK